LGWRKFFSFVATFARKYSGPIGKLLAILFEESAMYSPVFRSVVRSTAVAAFTLGVSAAHAGARPSEAALMDACVKQYIAENLANYEGKVTVEKLAPEYLPVVLNMETKIMVSAVHKPTGTHLGTVKCSVSREGKISVSAPDAAAAAKLARLIKSSTPVIASASGK
jgi:hypothetical protein